MEIWQDEMDKEVTNSMICPECSNKLYPVSGCFYCPFCGFLSCEQ